LIPQPRPRLVTRLHLAWIFVDRHNLIQPDWRKRLCYWLEKQAILRADVVTAPSAAVLELTRTWLGSQLAARVVPNPIDIRGFSPNESPREREVLFVGRLERGKGLAIFCRVAPLVLSRCPDVRVRVLGSDGMDENGRSWRSRILDSVREEDRSRIAFEHVSRRELVNSYRQASVCIVPSLWENCPYVVLEAMACGTPVVATRRGGLPELIQHGRTGFLVGPEDAEGFADAICDLMNDPEKSRRMGLAARRQAESVFSTSTVAGRMVDVYRELCRC
jgi:glycosyltransferase involved in cell wall biosynthesis